MTGLSASWSFMPNTTGLCLTLPVLCSQADRATQPLYPAFAVTSSSLSPSMSKAWVCQWVLCSHELHWLLLKPISLATALFHDSGVITKYLLPFGIPLVTSSTLVLDSEE